jgi:hypothetical protein
MNPSIKQQSGLRDDRKTWRTVASILAGCALVSTAGAATITESATAPSGNILASQLTSLGPGAADNGRLYADNGGPPGQTFTVSSPSALDSIVVLGRGDSAGSWSGGAQPFTGSEVWGIQIARVNGDGSLTALATETATGFAAPANLSSYVNFKLGTPVSVIPGQTYAFSININSGGPWFGFAHSDTDVYAGGTAFNNNTNMANPGGNGGGNRYTFGDIGFAAPMPGNWDLVFAIQGMEVPEPTTFALLGLGGLGLIAAHMRRRA